MIKILAKSIREYKKPSLLAPVLVTGEVIMECIIPFVTANLVNQIRAGCSMGVILRYGLVLVVMATLSLAVRRGGGQCLRQGELRFCQESAQGYVLPDSGLFV